MIKKIMKMITDKKKMIEKVSYSAIAFNFAFKVTSSPVYASASTVTAPIDKLKSLLVGFVSAIGTIVVIKNLMEFAQSYQQNDSSGMTSALKGIAAGLMMALVSTVLLVIGIS